MPTRGADPGAHVRAHRRKAAAIRANFEEPAADRALGLIRRAQTLAATERGNLRLVQISDELADAARENVLTELVAADNAAEVWDQVDLSLQRAVITSLITISTVSAGQHARHHQRGRPGETVKTLAIAALTCCFVKL